jgi:hypothetical protein
MGPRGQQFIAELIGGTLSSPVTTATGVGMRYAVSDQPLPKSVEEWVRLMGSDALQGMLFQTLLGGITYGKGGDAASPDNLEVLAANNEQVRQLVEGRGTAPLPEPGGEMARSDTEVEVARKILSDRSAPPQSLREAIRTLIDRAVAEVRASLIARQLSSGGGLTRLTAHDLARTCQIGRDFTAEALIAHIGKSPHPVMIERMQAAHLGFDARHGFAVVTLPDGTKFLVDPTFAQFADQRTKAFTAESMLSSVEGSTLARDLLRDGMVPLTGDTARQYVMGLGASPADADAAAARLMFGDGALVTEIVRDGQVRRITARPDEADNHLSTVSDAEVTPLISLRETLKSMPPDHPLRPLLQSLTTRLETLARSMPSLPEPVPRVP